MNDAIRNMKKWAELTPPTPGDLPNGELPDVLRLNPNETYVMMIMDSRGRVFQLIGGKYDGGTIGAVRAGRTEVLRLLDQFDVQDAPAWERGDD